MDKKLLSKWDCTISVTRPKTNDAKVRDNLGGIHSFVKCIARAEAAATSFLTTGHQFSWSFLFL